MAGEFAPWSVGSAQREPDGTVVGTIYLRDDCGLRVVSAEVHGDGQFLTCVFKPIEPKEDP